MSLYFVSVVTDEHIHQLANMAGEIWREYWPDRIGADQTEYMVEQFQTYEAICRDMHEHEYEYWFVVEGPYGLRQDTIMACVAQGSAHIVGYTGGHNELETNRFFISKIYLYKEERGKHFASQIIEFYNTLCLGRRLDAMYLTVNKYNELGVRAYKSNGFEVIDSVETDIGEGFIMDDFIMERKAIEEN